MTIESEAKIRVVQFLMDQPRTDGSINCLAHAIQKLSAGEFKELKERI